MFLGPADNSRVQFEQLDSFYSLQELYCVTYLFSEIGGLFSLIFYDLFLYNSKDLGAFLSVYGWENYCYCHFSWIWQEIF